MRNAESCLLGKKNNSKISQALSHGICVLNFLATVAGCSRTHAHVTMSDWRDPLDPDGETQMIYSHLLLSRDELETKLSEYSELQAPAETENQCTDDSGDNQGSGDKYLAAASRLLEAINQVEEYHRQHAKGEDATMFE